MRITEKMVSRADELRQIISSAQEELKPLLDAFKARGTFSMGSFSVVVTDVQTKSIMGLEKIDILAPMIAAQIREMDLLNHSEYKTVKISKHVQKKAVS